jgi:peptidoglycan/xylan/chitin deacetylase (PgdA/CDA1 family)
VGGVDWGPDGLDAALALTFDNLSEPGVEEAVPRLLERLDALGLRATFCVEAVNCERRPELVRALHARGHEVACHGWRHEHWEFLESDEESALLARSRDAFAALGLDVRGFRPPGGQLTRHSERLLREHGFEWCSPEGESYTRRAGLVHLPFRWALVDAAYFLPSLRGRIGLDGEPAAPALLAAFGRALDELSERGAEATVILHPFLRLDVEAATAADAVLVRIAERAAAGRVWVAPAQEVAAAVAAAS